MDQQETWDYAGGAFPVLRILNRPFSAKNTNLVQARDLCYYEAQNILGFVHKNSKFIRYNPMRR